MNFGDLSVVERIMDENEDAEFVKKIKGVSKMETPEEIKDFVFAVLKRDDRKADLMTFLTDTNNCHSLEVLKELAEWYVSKPKLRSSKR